MNLYSEEVPKPPNEELFSLECEHKYCNQCMDSLSGKPCLICKQGCVTKEDGPDELTTKILKKMRDVEKSLELSIQQMKSVKSITCKRETEEKGKDTTTDLNLID